jgi:hypothetical protein
MIVVGVGLLSAPIGGRGCPSDTGTVRSVGAESLEPLRRFGDRFHRLDLPSLAVTSHPQVVPTTLRAHQSSN